MKYCIKCGNQMSDEMIFCQKCGTQISNIEYNQQVPEQQPPQQIRKRRKPTGPRNGMKVAAIIFFCLGLLWVLLGIVSKMFLFGFGMALPSFALAGIFYLYYKTPRYSDENKFYIGDKAVLPKTVTIIAMMMIALTSCTLLVQTGVPSNPKVSSPIGSDNSMAASTERAETALDSTSDMDVSSEWYSSLIGKSNETTGETADETADETAAIGIDAVYNWYTGKSDEVATSAVNFIGTQANVTDIIITENTFEFNELFGCVYFIYFQCNVGRAPAHGHTTVFMEYQGSETKWIDFEISMDNDGTILVEWYNANIDTEAIAHYKYLTETY